MNRNWKLIIAIILLVWGIPSLVGSLILMASGPFDAASLISGFLATGLLAIMPLWGSYRLFRTYLGKREKTISDNKPVKDKADELTRYFKPQPVSIPKGQKVVLTIKADLPEEKPKESFEKKPLNNSFF